MLNQGPPWSPMESHVNGGEDDSEVYQTEDINEVLVDVEGILKKI